MAHYGTLRDYRFADNETEDDIRGSNVYSAQNDDKLGDIDDVIFDHSTGEIRYVVIDTGGWLSSKKFIVPPTGCVLQTNTRTISWWTPANSRSRVSLHIRRKMWSRKSVGKITRNVIKTRGMTGRCCTATAA